MESKKESSEAATSFFHFKSLISSLSLSNNFFMSVMAVTFIEGVLSMTAEGSTAAKEGQEEGKGDQSRSSFPWPPERDERDRKGRMRTWFGQDQACDALQRGHVHRARRGRHVGGLKHRKVDATLEHCLESGRQGKRELHCCIASKTKQEEIKKR